LPSILDYLQQGALAPSLVDPAFAAEMAQLRKMTPEQLRAQSLREQDLQRRSALLGQRPPIHYGGLPLGITYPKPIAGFWNANAAPR
jgi:hypothetical protein